MSDVFKRLKPWLKKHERLAWLPEVEEGDGDPTDSKFCGTPCLPDGQWPTCGCCGKPMPLFLQINLAKIPKAIRGAFGEGLLQFFLCTDDKKPCYAEGYGDAFARTHLVRIIPPKSTHIPTPMPRFEIDFEPMRIVGWDKAKDYPSQPEHESLGLTVDYDADNGEDRATCLEFGIENEEANFDEYLDWISDRIVSAEKLSGWPVWKQNVEYAECNQCGQPMTTMVFQINDEENIPFMLADGGQGQILQCPHDKTVGFIWASG